MAFSNIYGKFFNSIFFSKYFGLNQISIELQDITSNEKKSEKELDKLQLDKLRKLVAFLANNKGYYYEYAKKSDIHSHDVSSILRGFPILEKKDLSAKGIVYQDPKKLLKFSSSGSSGIRSDCYLSNKEVAIDRAIQIRWWQWAGVEFGKPIFQTGNNKRNIFKKTKDILFRTSYISAFSIDNKVVAKEILGQKNGGALCGYASSLYAISKACEEELAIDLKSKFTTAVSWGDKLFPHYRKNILDTFGIQVYETYGCAEGLKIASQYDLEYLYIMAPNLIVEVVDDKGLPVEDGKLGHILITSLDRYAMPMIRYRIGDIGVILPRSDYPKNRKINYPILKRVVGRDTDIILLPDNRKLIVHSFTAIFEYIKAVKQFRIIQNELDSIIIEIILAKGEVISSVREDVINKLRKLWGDNLISLSVIQVESIPNTPSGKPQIIKSNIDYLER